MRLGGHGLLAPLAAALMTVACSPSAAEDGSGGGDAGSEGPPFEVGPKQYGSYLGFDTQGTHDCTVWLDFVYYAPLGAGPFPIFVFAKGTRGAWDDDSLIHDEMLVRMATLGFVAASPDYQSNVDVYPGPYGLTCPGLSEKSRCMFSPADAHADSLVAALERDTAAASERGIAASGISQGGYVALLAGDHNAQTRAANPISIGIVCGSILDLSACVLPTAHRLSPDQVRVVNGESDGLFSGASLPTCDGTQPTEPVWYREQLNVMTAMSCDTGATVYECLRENGSGWVLARDDQVVGGQAHHAFPYAEYPTAADPNWASTTAAWGREANQRWMAERVGLP